VPNRNDNPTAYRLIVDGNDPQLSIKTIYALRCPELGLRFCVLFAQNSNGDEVLVRFNISGWQTVCTNTGSKFFSEIKILRILGSSRLTYYYYILNDNSVWTFLDNQQDCNFAPTQVLGQYLDNPKDLVVQPVSSSIYIGYIDSKGMSIQKDNDMPKLVYPNSHTKQLLYFTTRTILVCDH